MRRCATCREWKDEKTAFGSRPNSRGDIFIRTECKECRNARERNRRALDPEWAERHREKNRLSERKRRASGKRQPAMEAGV
jgi:hypothetical protein